MGTTTITIPLDSDLARVYNSASPEVRRKIQAFISLWLSELAAPGGKSLDQLMDSISDKAQARGLTSEILESLLSDSDQ
jgi:hypothetical protein